MIKTPPLLIGASLLFWGWQTGYLSAGIVMAAIAEGSRLINRRWELSPLDFHRIADLCAIIIIALAAYRFLAGTASSARWLPMEIFPLLAGQSLSSVGGVDLGALFYTARQREKKGELKTRRTVDVSYPYFAFVLLATSAANVRTPVFYCGIFMLIGWALLSVRPRGAPLILWTVLFLLAGGLGWTGQIGLRNLHLKIEDASFGWYQQFMGRDLNLFRTVTAIGDVGELKLSNRIVLRVRIEENASPPEHLLEASYSTYKDKRWFALGQRFHPLAPVGNGTVWRIGEKPENFKTLTISGRLRRGKGILSLPLDAYRIENLPVSILERNRYGVVRVQGGPGMVNYGVRFGSGLSYHEPYDEKDLVIPAKELPAVRQIAKEAGLSAEAPRETIATLKAFFQKRFKYSLILESSKLGSTPLANFLLKSRSGHCEYFATATVLILRVIGIPARYATGYRVDEYSRLEEAYVVRARHAHAWALAFIDGAWRHVDTTPAIWLALEKEAAPALEPVYDLFRWIGHSFSRWRWSESKGGLPVWVVWFIVPLAILLIWRIVFRKRAASAVAGKEKLDDQKSIPVPESAFYRIEEDLARQGFTRRKWETQTTFIRKIEAAGPGSDAVQGLNEMLTLHYRIRFHPGGAKETERAQLQERVTKWLHQYGSAGRLLSAENIAGHRPHVLDKP